MGGCIPCTDTDDAIPYDMKPAVRNMLTTGKIVIVGAGPAGIHMASLLIKAGCDTSNITLLEKSDRICGKSYSVNDKGLGANDQFPIIHEMGTCYLHPDYKVIFKLFEEYDADNELKGIPSRGVFGTSMNEEQINKTEQKHIDFTSWMMAEAEQHAVPKEFHFIHDKISGGVAFVDAARKYINAWEEIFGKAIRPDRYGMPERPSDENLKRLNCTFLEWIQNEGVEALVPLFVYTNTCQGYGVLDKIGAFYGLYWNNPELVLAPVWTAMKGDPAVIVVEKGYQQLWRRIAAKHDLNIMKNVQIQGVDRALEDETKRICVQYKVGKAEDYHKHPDDEELDLKEDDIVQEMECDYLFLACGARKSLSFLNDATEQEKEVFGALRPHTFCTTIYESNTDTEQLHERVVEMWPNIQWKANGQLGLMRNSIKCWLDHEKYDELVKDGTITKDRSVSYQFEIREPNKDRAVDEEYFAEILKKDLETWGEEEVRIIFQKVWDYFPVWSVEDVQKGYPWIVRDEMQGKQKNTFYIGSSVCFESVLNCVEYNNRIFDQYFGTSPPTKK